MNATQPDYTETEIKHFADIYMRWYRRDKYAFPSRYSINVKSAAVIYGFAVKQSPSKRTYHISNYSHLDIRDLPVEVMWHILKPVIEQYTGYSITKDEIWYRVCNFHRGDISTIENVLLRLHMAGFITFYSAGSIWRIEIVTK